MNYKCSKKGFIKLVLCISVLLSITSCSKTPEQTTKSNCPSKNCSDFSTQASAQATFNSDRNCYKSLDSDSDGIACENLP